MNKNNYRNKPIYKTMKTELGVHNHFRLALREWKEASLEECNRTCIITGTKDNLEVHHINKKFVDIVREAYKSLGKTFRFRKDEYYLGELDEIAEEVVKLHFKYGLGVAITRSTHRQYHRIYKDNINPKTLHQFSEDFKSNKIA